MCITYIVDCNYLYRGSPLKLPSEVEELVCLWSIIKKKKIAAALQACERIMEWNILMKMMNAENAASNVLVYGLTL